MAMIRKLFYDITIQISTNFDYSKSNEMDPFIAQNSS